MRIRLPKPPKLNVDRFDLFIMVGVSSLAYGLYLIFIPAAPIAVGLFLIYAGVSGSRNGGGK